MVTDLKDPMRDSLTESALIARIRMKIETGDEEIGAGRSLVISTPQGDTYGFFELLSDRYPYMGIKAPADTNPYDLKDQTIVVDRVESIGRDYILENSAPGVLDVNAVLNLESFDGRVISFKEEDGVRYFDINSLGEISVHSDPRTDIPLQNPPESD